MNLNDLRASAYKNASKDVKNSSQTPPFIPQRAAKKQTDSEPLKDADRQIGKISDSKKSSGSAGELDRAADALTSRGLIKVPVSETETDGKDSVYRRVAKFLLLIGVDEAAKILPHLTEAQTERIIPEIASIRSVTPEEASVILEEFRSLLERSRESGGMDTARNILEKAYGPERAKQLLEKAAPFAGAKPFD